MTFAPTQEQEDARTAFLTGQPTLINAYAGTGKTSSLEYLARSTPRTGTYFAFNKQTADDARARFPNTVLCKTMHALAFGAMARRFPVPKMTANINAGRIAQVMETTPKQLSKNIFLTSRGWAFLVGETVKHWLRSKDDTLQVFHVRLSPAFEETSPEIRGATKQAIFRDAVKLWDMMAHPALDVPLTHDGYLKIWALGQPRIPGEYHLLDEAQDTNAVVLELLRHQTAQIVIVGDRFQSIYQWRGSQNAMTSFHVAYETRLSKSWRFGPEIADNASMVLRCLKETVPLIGDDRIKSRIGEIEDPDVILARTNAVCIEELMSAIEDGERPALVGGVAGLLKFVDAAEGLMAGVPSDHEDLIGFQKWEEVQAASDGPEGGELRVMVRTIDRYGPAKLKRALNGLPNEQNASLLISTAHKAKGREWKRVRLANDFLRGWKGADLATKTPAWVHESELMLYYVAATRARSVIEIPPIITERIRDLSAPVAAAKAPEPAPA